MAQQSEVFKNPFLSIDGEDLSAFVKELTLNYSADQVECTTGGSGKTHVYQPGLLNWSMSVTFQQDYSAGGLDSLLFGWVGRSEPPIPIIFRPKQVDQGVDNPEYTGDCMIESYVPHTGSPGVEVTTPVSILASSDLIRT